MKNTVEEFIELSQDEKKELWNNAIFIFDTNILLNLYRYSSETSKTLISYIKQLEERVWLPYYVAYEFMKQRCEVIFERNKIFNQIQENTKHYIENMTKILKLNHQDSDIKALDKLINKWLKKYKDIFKKIKYNEDYILKDLLTLFKSKVGNPYSKETYEQLENEGKERYKNNIPPGYKDSIKKENKYGDYIIWKEIIQFSKEHKKNIIFVTNDKKEDWWNIIHGETIGIRVELRKEFLNETNQKIHMYDMQSFINNYDQYKSVKIDTKIINEINFVENININILSESGNVIDDMFQQRSNSEVSIKEIKCNSIEIKEKL